MSGQGHGYGKVALGGLAPGGSASRATKDVRDSDGE